MGERLTFLLELIMKLLEAIREMNNGHKISHYEIYVNRVYYRLKDKGNYLNLIDDKGVELPIDSLMRMYPTEEKRVVKGHSVISKTEWDSCWGVYDNRFSISLEV